MLYSLEHNILLNAAFSWTQYSHVCCILLSTIFSWILPSFEHYILLNAAFSWTPYSHMLHSLEQYECCILLNAVFSWMLHSLEQYILLNAAFSWTLYFLECYILLNTIFSWMLHSLEHYIRLNTAFSWKLFSLEYCKLLLLDTTLISNTFHLFFGLTGQLFQYCFVPLWTGIYSIRKYNKFFPYSIDPTYF